MINDSTITRDKWQNVKTIYMITNHMIDWELNSIIYKSIRKRPRNQYKNEQGMNTIQFSK